MLDDYRRWTQEDVNEYFDTYEHYVEKARKEGEEPDKKTKQIISLIRGGLKVHVHLEDKARFDRHLPQGYDGYWLHYSQTSLEAIEELKKEQPWSPIIVSYRGFDVPDELDKFENKRNIDVIHDNHLVVMWHLLNDVAIGYVSKK